MTVMPTVSQAQNPPSPREGYSSVWSIPLLIVGLAIVGICTLVPQWQANRQLAAERDKLLNDLDYAQTQISVNDRFLQSVGDDPSLAERLAQRQMQQIRKGTSVLELKGKFSRSPISPFALVSIAQPPLAPLVQPPHGLLAKLCDSPRRQLYCTGAGMFMIAVGLVLGSSFKSY